MCIIAHSKRKYLQDHTSTISIIQLCRCMLDISSKELAFFNAHKKIFTAFLVLWFLGYGPYLAKHKSLLFSDADQTNTDIEVSNKSCNMYYLLHPKIWPSFQGYALLLDSRCSLLTFYHQNALLCTSSTACIMSNIICSAQLC